MINLRSYSEYLALSIEIWIPIKGFEENYEVSSFGRIKSKSHKTPQKGWTKEIILAPGVSKVGYKMVTLSLNGVHSKKYIHRIVGEHFYDNPENKRTINHKNGIKLDNRAINLEWATDSENSFHAYRTNLKKTYDIKGENAPNNKHSKEKIIRVKTLLKEGHSYKYIADIENFPQHLISGIKTKKSWGWLDV